MCLCLKCVCVINRWGFSSVQFSRSVKSNSLRPHELQHTRSPCPSPTPGVHSTELGVHRVNDAIQPSHPLSSPSPPAPNPSQHQSLFHSIVFLCFFALITEEGFLVSPCLSSELCIQMGISFLFSFAFRFSSFHSYFKASLDNHFAFLHFFFLGMISITASCRMSQTSVHRSSGTLSIRSNPLNLFLTSTVKL